MNNDQIQIPELKFSFTPNVPAPAFVPTSEEISEARSVWDQHVGWLIKVANEDGPDKEHAVYICRLIEGYLKLAGLHYGAPASPLDGIQITLGTPEVVDAER